MFLTYFYLSYLHQFKYRKESYDYHFLDGLNIKKGSEIYFFQSANLTAYVIHTVFYFIFFFLNLSEMAPHWIFSVLFPAHDHAEYLV
mgnify:CR=1 FL=1